MNKTIVFDFDKTLTYKDSLTQFFYERMRGWRILYFPYYIFLKILSKFKIISVLREKELALTALCPTDLYSLNNLLLGFAYHIKLNTINEIVKASLSNGDRVLILSASPEIYLKNLYPLCEVIGLQFSYDKGVIISQHPYGGEKLRLLKTHGIERVDEFYYDSKSDESVFPICKEAYRVHHGDTIEKTL